MRETTPFIVQLKVSLAEVESAIGVIDQAQADLTKRHQELDTRRNNLRALIRESRLSHASDPGSRHPG